MASVAVHETYDEPADNVWSIFADYGNVHEIHPGIEDSKTLKDVQGLGGMRACEFGKGQGVDEEIVAWEKNRIMSFKATEFRKLPMKEMKGTFHFEGDSPTTVTIVMDYQMRGGPLMNFMAKGMMKKAGSGMLQGAKKKLA